MLLDLVLALFGYYWVFPKTLSLAGYKNAKRMGKNVECTWKACNSRIVREEEHPDQMPKDLFLRSPFDWVRFPCGFDLPDGFPLGSGL